MRLTGKKLPLPHTGMYTRTLAHQHTLTLLHTRSLPITDAQWDHVWYLRDELDKYHNPIGDESCD